MTRRQVFSLVAACAIATWAGVALTQDKPQAIETLLNGYRDAGAFNGAALVAENGRVIFKKGFGLADFEWQVPNTADTRFRLGSITKQFTATLVMELVEQGKLSLDTTLAAALPYYRKDTGAKITIHQLLNHTSGIPSYTGLPNFIKDKSRDPYRPRDFVLKYCSGDLEFTPGERFSYNNSGYFLLGAILEHATGKSYEQLLRERIFEPLGMTSSGYDVGRTLLPKRARGYERPFAGVRNADFLDMSIPYAAGSLYSTAEDLYLWDQALYAGKVLKPASREKMFTPGLEDYGYGWNIRKQKIGPEKAERVVVGHGGGINGFNTLIMRVPDDKHLVVLLNNTGGTNLGAMFDGIADILYGRTPPPPKPGIANVVYETMRRSGVTAAVAEYREIKDKRASEYDMREGQLLRLGRELLGEERSKDAVEIFKLSAEMFPLSGNSHEGLAEAYRAQGDVPRAIQSYARALELNPRSRNAAEKLAELKKQE
jgi:CubicO group peptidase (beta-lactamase class C family)